jgi:hypothetical protein
MSTAMETTCGSQVLIPVGTLDRDKQLGVVKELTEIVAAAAGAPTLAERSRVLLTEAPEDGAGSMTYCIIGWRRPSWERASG